MTTVSLRRRLIGFAGRHGRALSATALVIAAWLAAGVFWYLTHRAGQPKSIDEYGYFSISLADYSALSRIGPSGWVDAVLGPSIQAPLTTAVTSLAFAVTGPSFTVGIGVILLAGAAVLALFAIYLRGFVRGPFAWAGVVTLATAPMFLELSRSFVFAVPLMLVMMGALLAIQRSDGFRRPGWSIAFGVFLGLAPLTRTMAVAFVPLFVLAALLTIVATPGRRLRRLLMLAASGAVSAAVVGVWLAPNFQGVFDYLTGFGYGSSAQEYARSGLDLLANALAPLTQSLHLAHLLVLVIGFVAAIVAAIVALRSSDRESRLAWIGSPLVACLIVGIGGLAVLSTSPNAGLGFGLPLLPPLIALGAWGGSRLVTRPRLAWITSTIVMAACVVMSSPFLGVSSPLSVQRDMTLPLVGGIVAVGGSEVDQAYFGTVDAQNQVEFGPGWQALNSRLADLALSANGPVRAAFGFRGLYVNVNSFQVSVMTRIGYASALAQIDPIVGSTVDDFRRWLTIGDAGSSCVLFTSDGARNEFRPNIDEVDLVSAAQLEGFSRFGSADAPDGRTIVAWARRAPGCPSYLP